MGVRDKFRKIQRTATGDPEGVLATLLVTKRLLKERNSKEFFEALDNAVELAAPKDPSRAWWAAHRAVVDAIPAGFTSLIDFIDSEGTTPDDLDGVMERAISAQGLANQAVSKGKRP